MPDVVRKIEITAALSNDYQAAFRAAADVARDTSKQLQDLTKREQDLQRLAALDAQRAAAAAIGDRPAAGGVPSEAAEPLLSAADPVRAGGLRGAVFRPWHLHRGQHASGHGHPCRRSAVGISHAERYHLVLLR